MKTLRASLAATLFCAMGATGVTPTAARAEPPPPPPPAAKPAAAPTLAERVAAVKQSFAQSQATLRKYEWLETTVVSLKGEEKSRKQNRCYYGAEGKLEKVPLAEPAPAPPARGLRGKIKEKKKEELADYMDEAAALVHKYLPPDHVKIQACADAGKASILILEPEKRARLNFTGYLQPGDTLSVDIDLTNNTILGTGVSSALGNGDAVTLDVRFDKFPDGTIYTAESNLDAKAKNVKVTVTNSGYRRTGP
jgi:hypothetical protein